MGVVGGRGFVEANVVVNVERANAVRKRVPFVYWLIFDIWVGTLIALVIADGEWFGWVVLPFWLVAVFFDVTESIVKWGKA